MVATLTTFICSTAEANALNARARGRSEPAEAGLIFWRKLVEQMLTNKIMDSGYVYNSPITPSRKCRVTVQWNTSLWRSHHSLESGIQWLVTGLGDRQSIWRKSVIGAIEWFVRIVYVLNRLPCAEFALETLWLRLRTQVSTPLISGGIFLRCCWLSKCSSSSKFMFSMGFLHCNSVVHYLEVLKLIPCNLEVIETLAKNFVKMTSN